MAEAPACREPTAGVPDTAGYRRQVARFVAARPDLVGPAAWDAPARPAPARPLLAALGADGLLAPTLAGEAHDAAAALWYSVALHEELARPGGHAGAVVLTHTEVGTRLLAAGPAGAAPAAQAAAGRRTAALAVTEPAGGLDVDAMSTVVRADGAGLRLTGEKWFSSNAPIADDLFVLARDARLGDTAPGRHTLLRVPSGAAGVTVTALRTAGHQGLTGRIVLDDVALAAEQAVGTPGTGLLVLLRHWPHERVMLAVRMTALAHLTVHTALSGTRRTGQRPDRADRADRADRPDRLHVLADLLAAVEQERAAAYHAVRRLGEGCCPPELAAGCKYRAATVLRQAAEQALLLLGGDGPTAAAALAEQVARDASGLTLAGGSDAALLTQIGRALR